MPLTFRAAAGANGTSTSTTTVVTTLPAGAAAGDLLVLGVCFGAAGTFSTLAGWTLVAQAANPTGSTHTAGLYSRVMQAGDTAPTVTFSVAAKRSYVCSAWTPAAGETPAVYAQATTLISASGTAATPNPATSSDPDSVSYVFNGTRVQVTGATAVTQTPPSTPAVYTEPANGDQCTAVGTTQTLRQVGAHVAYRATTGTGPVAPGAFSFSLAVIDIAIHVLLRSASYPQMPQILTRSPRPAEQNQVVGPYAPQSSSTLLPGG